MNWNAKEELQRAKQRYQQALREWHKNNPYVSASRTTRETFVLNALSSVGDSYGVESLQPVRRDASLLLYANTGETYALTILAFVGYDRTLFKIGNWGDLVESGRYKGYA